MKEELRGKTLALILSLLALLAISANIARKAVHPEFWKPTASAADHSGKK